MDTTSTPNTPQPEISQADLFAAEYPAPVVTDDPAHYGIPAAPQPIED